MSRIGALVVVLCLAGGACGDASALRPAGDGTPAPVSTEVTVTCEDRQVEVSAPSVVAGADGVHLMVDNRDGAERILYTRGGRPSASVTVPEGQSAVVVATQPPGEWALLCSPASIWPGDDAPGTALTVLDPAGHWADDSLGCEHPTSTHPDYEEYFTGGTPTGIQGDVLELARAEATGWGAGVGAGDEIEPAGYPEATPRLFRAVRGGEAVALAGYQSDGRGGWFFGSVEYCE